MTRATNVPSDVETHGGPSTARLVVAWIWVGIPLAWGVISTVMKSVPLFR